MSTTIDLEARRTAPEAPLAVAENEDGWLLAVDRDGTRLLCSDGLGTQWRDITPPAGRHGVRLAALLTDGHTVAVVDRAGGRVLVTDGRFDAAADVEWRSLVLSVH